MSSNALINAIKALSKTNVSVSTKDIIKHKETSQKKDKKIKNKFIQKIKQENKKIYVNKKVMGATKVKPNDLFTYQKISFINVYDFTFDSKLEFYCFHSFMLNKIKFIFKPKFTLQEKILSGKKVAVKAITISPDFELLKDGKKLVVDTKGHFTEASKLRFKMLANKLTTEKIDHEIIILRTPKDVKDFCKRMLNITK